MGLGKFGWSFGKDPDEGFISLYKGEDMHPGLEDVFDWAEQRVFSKVGLASRDNVILAGGALRSFFTKTPVRDYDLYFKSETVMTVVEDNFVRKMFRKEPVTSDDSTVWNLTTISGSEGIEYGSYNCIKQYWAKEPEDVLRNYDFTVCMCAVTTDRLIYHPDYFLDLQTKQLRLHNPGNPLNTLWRVQKYNQKGFSMSANEMWKLVERIHDMDKLPDVAAQGEPVVEGKIPVADVFRGS